MIASVEVCQNCNQGPVQLCIALSLYVHQDTVRLISVCWGERFKWVCSKSNLAIIFCYCLVFLHLFLCALAQIPLNITETANSKVINETVTCWKRLNNYSMWWTTRRTSRTRFSAHPGWGLTAFQGNSSMSALRSPFRWDTFEPPLLWDVWRASIMTRSKDSDTVGNMRFHLGARPQGETGLQVPGVCAFTHRMCADTVWTSSTRPPSCSSPHKLNIVYACCSGLNKETKEIYHWSPFYNLTFSIHTVE